MEPFFRGVRARERKTERKVSERGEAPRRGSARGPSRKTHLDQVELAPHANLLQGPRDEGPRLPEVLFPVLWEEHGKGGLVDEASRVLVLAALWYGPVMDALVVPGLFLSMALVLRDHDDVGAVAGAELVPFPRGVRHFFSAEFRRTGE